MTDIKRTSQDIAVTSNDHVATHDSSVVDEKHSAVRHVQDPSKPFPTEEEWATLPKVAGKIPWQAWTVAICEFAERFSYYGTTAVFVNFIQKPLPPDSRTGAGFLRKGKYGSGALGMGQRASTGLTTFNAFWSYITPLGGAYIADQYLGRYATIQWAIMFAMVGHCILIISAIPPVIVKGSSALACFTIGLVIMGLGTGGFKSNISPLIAEQYLDTQAYVRTKKNGKKEIVDPAATSARIYLYFYLLINCGSLTGSLAMVYAEHYVGFWLSFLLPTLVFAISPLVLFVFKKHYHLTPPTGSVMGKAFKLIGFAFKGKWSWNPVTLKRNLKDDQFWNRVKPSNIPAGERPAWMTFDDLWVDEVRRGLLACKVFLWYPLYWLAYNQMTNNLTSQANTLKLGAVPNDILNNLNPISIIILVPVMDYIIYPAIRKTGFDFTPIKKITGGFMLASFSMIAAAVTQAWIYKNGPCGTNPNYRMSKLDENCEANLSVWIQTLPYVLIGMSEVLASITKLEYAYTKAPKNMRSTVQAIALSTSAISSALSQALVALSEDPLLVWNYGSVAVVAFAGGVGFYFTFIKADKQEHQLNALQASAYEGRHISDVESRNSSNIDVTGAAVVPTEKI